MMNTVNKFVGLVESRRAKASDGGVHPPHYPWDFNNLGTTLDAKSLRRGWHVYQKVSYIT